MLLVSGFALGGAVQFKDGVDANFPDPLGDRGLLGADGEFALVFAAAEVALDGDMRASGEGAGKIGQFPEGHTSMPLGARFPGDGVIIPFFQDVLVASEKIARFLALLTFFPASLPMKPMRVILLR